MNFRSNCKTITLQSPVTRVPFVGPAFATKLSAIGINTIEDLLWHIPARYLDTREVSNIAEVQDDGTAYVLTGRLTKANPAYLRGHRFLFNGQVTDHTGTIDVVWFNQRYLATSLHTEDELILYGKAKTFRDKLVLQSPEFEIISKTSSASGKIRPAHLGVVAPIYRLTEGITQRWLRSRVQYVAGLLGKTVKAPDKLPAKVVDSEKLLGRVSAFREIHLPKDNQVLEQALYTLSFEELFGIMTKLIIRREQKKLKRGPEIKVDPKVTDKLVGLLPFKLTDSQNIAMRDILSDFSRKYPGDRLLNGDVGSGKTIVAVATALQVLNSGYNVLIMAPTTILANQHYATVQPILKNFGYKTDLILGSGATMPSPTCQRPAHSSSARHPCITIGTHALLYQPGIYENVGLVVIDEQHRFGVFQRDELSNLHTAPHLLTLTATPIPRTLALVFFGDQEISYLDTVPHGRKKIKSKFVTETNRGVLYDFIRQKLQTGDSRVFVVCPLIEESEKLQTKAVETVYKEIKQIFFNTAVGFLHGRLKNVEKQKALDEFKSGKTQVLVTTPVIEVGIDIPQADIMLIEGAERFGLAQLHQLRGRVGRGSKQSYCFVTSSNTGKNTIDRIRFFCQTDNGLKLSEYDLKNRGPGEVYGYKQSGLPELKVAKLDNIAILTKVKTAAEKYAKNRPEKKAGGKTEILPNHN